MKFNIKTFYLIGMILMLISSLGSIWNLIIIWEKINIGSKISSLAGSVLFQLLIFGFFLFMYKQSSNIPDMNMTIQNQNLDKLLKEIQGGEQ